MAKQELPLDPGGLTPELDLVHHAYTAHEELLKKRIIYFHGALNLPNANFLTQRLLQLDLIGEQIIHLFMTSPGGNDEEMWAIIDLMNWMRSPIYTYLLGRCSSAASSIFINGDKRFMFPNSFLMVHLGEDPEGHAGNADSQLTFARQYKKETQQYISFIAEITGKKEKTIATMLEKGDKWFDPEQAIKYGLADSMTPPQRPASLARKR